MDQSETKSMFQGGLITDLTEGTSLCKRASVFFISHFQGAIALATSAQHIFQHAAKRPS
ncbi:hypothetical protein [Candidatus Aalborgicola defluviihabitans]|uniref:hypothetical protein n=1 Tax=Candidatus Aalborgicola defluviihabitans TaxID=3386187 RepID=UPI001ED25CE4|nr:hypothetical protein [Burkholderiales bacterium]